MLELPSYKLTDWANFPHSATHAEGNIGNLSPEFKDFVGGVTIGLATLFNFLNMPAKGIFRTICSVFLVGCIQTNPTNDHQQLANALMYKGDIAADEAKFTEALAFYETGLNHALNLSIRVT